MLLDGLAPLKEGVCAPHVWGRAVEVIPVTTSVAMQPREVTVPWVVAPPREHQHRSVPAPGEERALGALPALPAVGSSGGLLAQPRWSQPGLLCALGADPAPGGPAPHSCPAPATRLQGTRAPF